MPLPSIDIQHDSTWHYVYSLQEITLFIIEILFKMPADLNHSLGTCMMPMNRQHRARLQGIQHSLRLVFSRIPQIQIHPKPGRYLGLSSQFVQNPFIYNHSAFC